MLPCLRCALVPHSTRAPKLAALAPSSPRPPLTGRCVLAWLRAEADMRTEAAEPVSAPAEAGSGPENADQVNPLASLSSAPRSLSSAQRRARAAALCGTPHARARPSPSDPPCGCAVAERGFCCALGQAALAEKAATEAQEKIDAQALPIRTYLDQTVVPILLQGLSDLVKQRCPRARVPAVATLATAPLPNGQLISAATLNATTTVFKFALASC